VIASGADRAAGREMAPKVEEASWLPSAYRDLETFLHGHLPATGSATGLVLILADRSVVPAARPGSAGPSPPRG
jgi:fructoselysine-6-P-deglycase FrlB-like protein